MPVTRRAVLRHIQSLADAYQQLASQLDFSGEFVNNLDALFDELSANLLGPIQITWQGTEATSARMGEDYNALLAVLNDAVEERDDLTLILLP